MRWLFIASLFFASFFFAGCHWLFGHSPPLTEGGASDRSWDLGDLPVATDRSGDHAAVDQPGQDLVKADQPKADQAKVQDLVKADQPKADQPTADQAKVQDLAKADQPKADQGQASPVSLDVAPPWPHSISGTGTTNWDHTIGCSDAVLVVGIAWFGTVSVTDVTQAGVTMDLGASHTGSGVGTALYYRVVPQTGTVEISVTGSGAGTIVAGSASFCDANTGTLSTWLKGGSLSTNWIAYSMKWPKGNATVDVVATKNTNLTFTPLGHTGLWTYQPGVNAAGLGWTSLPGGWSSVGWTGTGTATATEWSYVSGVLQTK